MTGQTTSDTRPPQREIAAALTDSKAYPTARIRRELERRAGKARAAPGPKKRW